MRSFGCGFSGAECGVRIVEFQIVEFRIVEFWIVEFRIVEFRVEFEVKSLDFGVYSVEFGFSWRMELKFGFRSFFFANFQKFLGTFWILGRIGILSWKLCALFDF